MTRLWLHHFFLLLALVTMPAWSEDVYQQPEEFLAETFPNGVPKPAALWMTGEIKKDVEAILGHEPNELRATYWYKDGRSAWILEEIGKERPITTGIVIDRGQIERIKVLVYRENRGWEVRYPFFTDQFKGAELQPDRRLDRPVDNISGATMSVDALIRMARLALYFHTEHVVPAQRQSPE